MVDQAELAPHWKDALEVAGKPGFWRWRQQVAATGGCAAPIHLTGGSRMILAATGEILHSYTTDDEPGERLLVACGNRRTSRCPSCAETYRADSYQLIKAGMAGGKGTPESVRDHPRVFATFTAPSFGAVHHRVVGSDDKVRRCHPHGQPCCRRRHRKDDPQLGQPLDPARYGYAGAVIWNALAASLWARTMTLLRRELAGRAGLSQRAFADECRLSFGKVAEYQTRALVHFHAVLRLDGIDANGNAGTVPPGEWADVELLTDAIRAVVARAVVYSPDCEATGGPCAVRWGDQLDIRSIRAFDGDQELSDEAVAGYIAKYATKGAECTGTIDTPICCRLCKGTGVANPAAGVDCDRCSGTGTTQPVEQLQVTDHGKRMLLVCWALGGLPELAELRLRPWAHMLGFGGHFSTKSRRYSTTLTRLRNVRREWRTTKTIAALGLEPDTPVVHRSEHDQVDDHDDGTVLVLGHWRYAGRGHSAGQALFAKTIAEDIAENRRIARQANRDPDQLWNGAA
jgi:hypothetical protein